MAKAKSTDGTTEGGVEGGAATGSEAEVLETAPKAVAPNGYRRLSEVTDAPWFDLSTGNICQGRLLGRYLMKSDPPRAYYQVEVAKPCKVVIGKGEEATVVMAEKGDVINVGETAKVAVLAKQVIPEVMAGAEYDVWINIQKKIKISGARTMWVIEVSGKQLKAPTGPIRSLSPEELLSSGDDNTPF